MELLTNLVAALNANAGAIQAIATVVLVCITWKYVKHSARLAETSERQADTIVKQSKTDQDERQRERDDRRLLVHKNLFVELGEAQSEASFAARDVEMAIEIETHMWDNMRGDLGYLRMDVLRLCDAVYRNIKSYNNVVRELRSLSLPVDGVLRANPEAEKMLSESISLHCGDIMELLKTILEYVKNSIEKQEMNDQEPTA